MMAAQIKKKKRVVVLAADAGRYSLPTVELALQLAASVDRRLHGLFVEDEDLLQLSDLPFTREITLVTARERPMGLQRMQHALRSRAEQFRRSLEQEARTLKVKFSFDYVRGRTQDIGLQSAADAAFIVFAQSAAHGWTPDDRQSRRRILMIGDGSKNQLRALRVVLERFGQNKIELILVQDGVAPEFMRDLKARIARSGKAVSLTEIPRVELAHRLTKQGAGFDCAILSRQQEPEELAMVLQYLRCPVVLVK